MFKSVPMHVCFRTPVRRSSWKKSGNEAVYMSYSLPILKSQSNQMSAWRLYYSKLLVSSIECIPNTELETEAHRLIKQVLILCNRSELSCVMEFIYMFGGVFLVIVYHFAMTTPLTIELNNKIYLWTSAIQHYFLIKIFTSEYLLLSLPLPISCKHKDVKKQ